MDTLTLFSKNLNQRSLTPRWPLTPCLLRSHVWLYPRIIVSKSHDNTSMYVDTVINFAKYHIHTHTYYIQNEWSHSLLLNSVPARQKIENNLTFFVEKFWENILTYFQKFSTKIFRVWSKNNWFHKILEKIPAKTESLGRSRLKNSFFFLFMA